MQHHTQGDTGPHPVAPLPQNPPHRTKVSNTLLVVAFLTLGWVAVPIWEPLLFAAIFAAALAGAESRLAEQLGGRRGLAATILTLAVIVLILAPLTFLGIVAVDGALDGIQWVTRTLRQGSLVEAIRPLPDGIEKLVARLVNNIPELNKLPRATNIQAGRWAALQVQTALGAVSALAFELAMMLIALFFLLADGDRLAEWIRRVSPIGRSRTGELLAEFRVVARSLIGSNFITGGAQATVATFGYYVSGVPQPLTFGLVTLLTSFIPSVGTAIVALPLAGLLALMGKTWSALFLAAWSLVVVGLVDNILRPYLIKGDLQVHGAVIFFSIIGGLGIFGVAGLVVGPMALTLFLTMMRFYARDARAAATPPVIPVTTPPAAG